MHAPVATREDGTRINPEWLVEAMREGGDISSAALARKLEVDDTTVYRWRKGGAPITMLSWRAVLHALNLPEGWEPKKRKPRSH